MYEHDIYCIPSGSILTRLDGSVSSTSLLRFLKCTKKCINVHSYHYYETKKTPKQRLVGYGQPNLKKNYFHQN